MMAAMLCVSVPARLSKISILNAIRSGTYVVNEPPPPPPPPADKDDDDDNRADNGAKMTDNGMVANEDTTQVAMTRMPEENLPEQENLPELPSLPTKKPHSVHRSEHRNGVTFLFTVHCHVRKCLYLYQCLLPQQPSWFRKHCSHTAPPNTLSPALLCPPKSLARMGLRSLVYRLPSRGDPALPLEHFGEVQWHLLRRMLSVTESYTGHNRESH